MDTRREGEGEEREGRRAGRKAGRRTDKLQIVVEILLDQVVFVCFDRFEKEERTSD
jgi:hypothetical protein